MESKLLGCKVWYACRCQCLFTVVVVAVVAHVCMVCWIIHFGCSYLFAPWLYFCDCVYILRNEKQQKHTPRVECALAHAANNILVFFAVFCCCFYVCFFLLHRRCIWQTAKQRLGIGYCGSVLQSNTWSKCCKCIHLNEFDSLQSAQGEERKKSCSIQDRWKKLQQRQIFMYISCAQRVDVMA